MRVAIAGGGWYGCHVASAIKERCTQLHLYEKNASLFSEASGNNQYRLHQGLHYPRSSETRHQSRDGYHRFCERYPNFAREVPRNYYLIPKDESLIDFDTYFSIMYSSGIKIKNINLQEIQYLKTEKFEGALQAEEKLILTSKARSYFESHLNTSLIFNERVVSVDQFADYIIVNGTKYDYFIDATWGALNSASEDLVFETTLLLYYEYRGNSEFPAITLMDGQLWALYPTEIPQTFSLSSVPHTPISRHTVKEEAYLALSKVTQQTIKAKTSLMEAQVKAYFPDFNDLFKYLAPQISIKTKLRGKTDNRAASVTRDRRHYKIQSGKIDNIFQASEVILGNLTKDGP